MEDMNTILAEIQGRRETEWGVWEFRWRERKKLALSLLECQSKPKLSP